MKTEPKVIIPRNIYDKVMQWVLLAKGREISGLGKCEYDAKTNTFKVVDAAVLEQSIQTSGNTEFTAESAGRYMYQSRELGEYMWWWHSHHSMGAFWSSTDRECIKSFADQGLVVATVFNNKYEHLTAVSYGKKVKAVSESTSVFGVEKEEIDEVREVIFDKIKAQVLTYYDVSVFDQWEAEYKAAEKKETTYSYGSRYPYLNTGKDVPKVDHRLPSKTVRKKWQQIKDFEKYVFEDPNPKAMMDWVYREGAWVVANDSDYYSKDLLEHPAWRAFNKNEDGKVISMIDSNSTQQALDDSIKHMDELDDDEDFSEADLMTDQEREDYEDDARLKMGLSVEEWKSMGRHEQEKWLERFDGYTNWGMYGY